MSTHTTGLAGSVINVGNSNTVLNLNNASFIGGDVDASKYKTQHQTANSTQTLFSDYTVCDHLQCNDLACEDWTGRYLYTNSVFAYNLDIGNVGLGTCTINSDVQLIGLMCCSITNTTYNALQTTVATSSTNITALQVARVILLVLQTSKEIVFKVQQY